MRKIIVFEQAFEAEVLANAENIDKLAGRAEVWCLRSRCEKSSYNSAGAD